MFSGIVERTAEVVSIRTDRQNKDFTLRADFCKELKIDQSIAHNGVCLTVVDITEDTYTVTAMKETLDRSNLGLLREGDLVNLERSMKPDALLDGHIVLSRRLAEEGHSRRSTSKPPSVGSCPRWSAKNTCVGRNSSSNCGRAINRRGT